MGCTCVFIDTTHHNSTRQITCCHTQAARSGGEEIHAAVRQYSKLQPEAFVVQAGGVGPQLDAKGPESSWTVGAWRAQQSGHLVTWSLSGLLEQNADGVPGSRAWWLWPVHPAAAPGSLHSHPCLQPGMLCCVAHEVCPSYCHPAGKQHAAVCSGYRHGQLHAQRSSTHS